MLTFTYGEIPAYKGDKNYWTSTTGYGYTSLEWIGLTEIGVETSAPAEESSEAPSDTSSETASDENSSSDSSAPATGDSGLTAFVVIAAAAIAFAVLAAKKRA